MQHRCQKLFCASWPVILCIQSAITCHDSNFKSWKKTRSSTCFYALDHKFLCVDESMMLVEAIMVVPGGMFVSRRGFYVVTKLFFIHQTINFYATSAPKTFLRILTIDSMHPISHHVPWFKFQIYEFKFFFEKYSQWILNRAQKCQEFNGENRFWIRCFVEEL